VSERDTALDEVVREFLVESAEDLDQLDWDLVGLKKERSSCGLLGGIFPAMHAGKRAERPLRRGALK
jgi:two-component system chemotaxis sensor kinase CheA